MYTDKYIVTEKTIKEPPVSLLGKLKFLGPGFILSASIVGSGELIATTILGAKAGFIAFWVILVSCFIKVAVQLEFGKQAILSGETAMSSFNKLPGIRSSKASWAVWTVFLLTSVKIIQVGGMIGGSAVVLNLLFGQIPILMWLLILALSVSAMIYRGYYNAVEKLSLLMIVAFTITTLVALYMLRYTSFRFSFNDVLSGLQFQLPSEYVAVAFGAFGITGVASDEIIAYNYWCIEKGYAAYTGPRNDSEAWKKRARGWINVMYLDAAFAMLVYTVVTAAFYLLGAAILHGKAEIPQGNEVIETVALIYTQSLGSGAKTIYLIGAFFVLFSSVFATLAAWTRLFPDIFGQLGWINFFDLAKRKITVSVLAWIFPLTWAFMYFFIRLPVWMILFGGIVGSVLLFLVVFAAIHFRKKRTVYFQSGFFYTLIFSLSVLSIIAVGVYGLIQLFFT